MLSAGLGTGPSADINTELQRDQVSLSNRSCQIIAENSGHNLPRGQPEAVVQAIQMVIVASRDTISKLAIVGLGDLEKADREDVMASEVRSRRDGNFGDCSLV